MDSRGLWRLADELLTPWTEERWCSRGPTKSSGSSIRDKQHGRGSEENQSPCSQSEASASTSEDEVRVTQRAAARFSDSQAVSRLGGRGCRLFVHTSGDNTLTSIYSELISPVRNPVFIVPVGTCQCL